MSWICRFISLIARSRHVGERAIKIHSTWIRFGTLSGWLSNHSKSAHFRVEEDFFLSHLRPDLMKMYPCSCVWRATGALNGFKGAIYGLILILSAAQKALHLNYDRHFISLFVSLLANKHVCLPSRVGYTCADGEFCNVKWQNTISVNWKGEKGENEQKKNIAWADCLN